MNLPIVKKTENPTGGYFFQVTAGEDVWKCARLAGGVAWPGVGRPGFLIVLAEDLDADMETGGTAVRVVAERNEYGGESFLSVEPVLECIRNLRNKLLCPEWFGLECPQTNVLLNYNRAEAKFKRNPIRIKELDDPRFERLIELVFRRTVVRKLLHFGESCLPGLLSALPADVAETGKFQNHPEITALLFALAGLDGTRPPQTRPKSAAVIDRVAGY